MLRVRLNRGCKWFIIISTHKGSFVVVQDEITIAGFPNLHIEREYFREYGG
ncbi:hypothetical protein BH24GEM2_BH24GEM2_19190 [soil metagenome]